MTKADAMKSIFKPFCDTLQGFSKKYHFNVNFVDVDKPWSDPHFELSWSLPSKIFVRMYLNRIDDNEFHLHVCKWNEKGRMERKDWNVTKGTDIRAFYETLEAAKAWAEVEQHL